MNGNGRKRKLSFKILSGDNSPNNTPMKDKLSPNKSS